MKKNYKLNNLTLIFNHFEVEHFGKDVFLVPYYLGKALDFSTTIVYPQTKTNKDFPSEVNGVKLNPIKVDTSASLSFKSIAPYFKYLISNASTINVLMLFRPNIMTFRLAWLYKMLNKQGRTYVKFDGGYEFFKCKYQPKNLIDRFDIMTIDSFCKNVNYATIETIEDFNYIKSKPDIFTFSDRLEYMPNGFDEDALQTLDIEEIPFHKKENIILTVGRLGTRQKNTQMLLDALNGEHLRGWKVLLVGPIEESFKSSISTFFEKNPDKKDSVIFTGPIYDKKELWSLYNKSKVFVFTSVRESYGLVLNEAYRFNNYIISTPVGAANDLITDNSVGKLIKINGINQLKETIRDIINSKINIQRSVERVNVNDISWEKVIQPLAIRIKEDLLFSK